ncbi:MAG: hypothetical protein ACFB51_20235 [Anaerolineae bacterium]
MLIDMGLDWVKLYDTNQIADYPGFKVLYRVDMRGYPADIDGWERGLYDLATELRNRGVDAVEIGNEPNLGFEWGGQRPNPEQFTDGLCRAYRAFKTNAPEITVIPGGIAPTITTPDGMNMTDFDFIQRMLNAGAANCFDHFAYHPYGFNMPPEASPYRHELVFRRTERVYAQLWDNGVRDKQIWITEMGWVRDPGEEGLDCANHPMFRDFNWMKFPADVVASYTGRAIRYAETNWSFAGPTFFWNLNWPLYGADYEPRCSHLRWYGFLDSFGQPLPVYYTVATTGKSSNPPSRNLPPTGPGPGDQTTKPPEDNSAANFPTPVRYPKVGVLQQEALSTTLEAGCRRQLQLGTFEIINAGYPGQAMSVEIIPANGPDLPRVWTSALQGEAGTLVDVFVDARDISPGLHMVAVNLRTDDSYRTTSVTVRGFVLVHYPTTPECVEGFNGP